ncbi:MAG: hypothetical protein RSC11_05665, partial [Mucinivorans sp.]
LAMIEAAAYSRSIVCSNLPVFKELFNEKLLEFYELNNIESLVTAVHKAYTLRDERGRLIRQDVLNKYSSRIMVDNYIKLYNKISK